VSLAAVGLTPPRPPEHDERPEMTNPQTSTTMSAPTTVTLTLTPTTQTQATVVRTTPNCWGRAYATFAAGSLQRPWQACLGTAFSRCSRVCGVAGVEGDVAAGPDLGTTYSLGTTKGVEGGELTQPNVIFPSTKLRHRFFVCFLWGSWHGSRSINGSGRALFSSAPLTHPTQRPLRTA
jgi:hypothetical protein